MKMWNSRQILRVSRIGFPMEQIRFFLSFSLPIWTNLFAIRVYLLKKVCFSECFRDKCLGPFAARSFQPEKLVKSSTFSMFSKFYSKIEPQSSKFFKPLGGVTFILSPGGLSWCKLLLRLQFFDWRRGFCENIL